jgi:DNA polymerase-3 subunit delta'
MDRYKFYKNGGRYMYFEKIKGQNFAKKYLTNSIKSNMVSHAYMFEGPNGIGKNTMARELAAILLEMENLFNSPDYIEIKPDGNSIKIAQIRKLQSDILVKPYKSYKIYVIDEAQKMTVEAQNALLKTLEEPPKYAIIILITDNKESLLDTIKSRCEIIKFTPIPMQEVASYLTMNGIDSKRASLLANFSRGSMKKAIELSESEEFHLMREEVQKYVETFLNGNLIEIMDIQSSIEKYKDQITNVLDLLINYFRDIMMVKENVDNSMIINLDRLIFVKNMSNKTTYSQLSKIIDIIEETKNKLRSNCNFNISIQVMTLNIYEVIK